MLPKIGQRYKNKSPAFQLLVEIIEIDDHVRFLVLTTTGSGFKVGDKFASGSLKPDGWSTGEWVYLEGQDKP